MVRQKVVAICGKGGVGKTVLSGALVRVLAERGVNILAVDADPAMGLSYILGLQADVKTLGNVREDLIRTARTNKDPEEVADATDYLLLEALIETEKFSFLAMGRSFSKGCFCPINSLLKESIRKLAGNYDVVLVDAEAGVEQINREVMSAMDSIVVIVDTSQRSLHSMGLIQEIAKDLGLEAEVGVVLNRCVNGEAGDAVKRVSTFGIPFWGMVPEDEGLRRNDATGKSIFDLPFDSPILESAKKVAGFLI